MADNPYSYPDYKSPYVRTEYTGNFRMRNKETGELEDVQTTRTVYQNTEWDPNLVIPAGTKIGIETENLEDMTNLQRMQNGKSPVIEMVDENGEIVYDKIELHHLTGEEIMKSSKYFNGETRDGTLVEVRASKHDEFSKQIHNVNDKDVSFRTEKVESIDEEGNTVRTREKTEENTHYTHTRETYWKDRAAEFIKENDYVDVPAQVDKETQFGFENDYVGIASETNVADYSTEYSNDNSNEME